MKLTNQDIKLALDGAHALSREDLPFPVAMKLYDAIESLTPKAQAIEAERIKLIQKHGEERDGGGWRVAEGTPAWEAFQAGYLELMSTEQEVATLPEIQISELGSADALKKLNVKAQELGGLRRVGVLVLDPPPANRAEKRRAMKQKLKAS